MVDEAVAGLRSNNPFTRDLLDEKVVFSAFREYGKAREKKRAIEKLKEQLELSDECLLYQALTHPQTADLFNLSANLRDAESWKSCIHLREHGANFLDTYLLFELQCIFPSLCGRQLEEERRLLLARNDEFGIVQLANVEFALEDAIIAEKTQLRETYIKSCLLAVVGACFIAQGYSSAEFVCDKLYSSVWEAYRENKLSFLLSRPLFDSIKGNTSVQKLRSWCPPVFTPTFNIVGQREGSFFCECYIASIEMPSKRTIKLSNGKGTSKREAKENAAYNFIAKLNQSEEVYQSIVESIANLPKKSAKVKEEKIIIEKPIMERPNFNDIKIKKEKISEETCITEGIDENLAPLLDEEEVDVKYWPDMMSDNEVALLNELLQKHLKCSPDYKFLPSKVGEDGIPIHTVELRIRNKLYARAVGSKKKGAKREAAKVAFPKVLRRRRE